MLRLMAVGVWMVSALISGAHANESKSETGRGGGFTTSRVGNLTSTSVVLADEGKYQRIDSIKQVQDEAFALVGTSSNDGARTSAFLNNLIQSVRSSQEKAHDWSDVQIVEALLTEAGLL